MIWSSNLEIHGFSSQLSKVTVIIFAHVQLLYKNVMQ